MAELTAAELLKFVQPFGDLCGRLKLYESGIHSSHRDSPIFAAVALAPRLNWLCAAALALAGIKLVEIHQMRSHSLQRVGSNLPADMWVATRESPPHG